jgi:cephalosporin hydroxylase
MTFAKKMNNKGRNIVKKYPQLFPLFRSLKILFFTKHHFSWWGSKMIEKYYIKKFSRIYFGTEGKYQRWQETTWLGVSALKLPSDMWVYQEIVYEVKPDIIIETGSMYGGSALFLATICDINKKGKIISIDINRKKDFPKHERIKFLTGSSTDKKTIDELKKDIGVNQKIIVILDSDHSKEHVLKELEIYNEFVSKDSYLIVEDTAINNHPILPNFGEGPWEAVEEFLKTHHNFVIDKNKEKFLLTWNPNGYLKKIND